jgi:tripartite-type tricarboxylate transporter receptor subunit TctC
MLRNLMFMIAVSAVAANGAAAQEYPSKPVRVIVGFAPGGPVDITARMVSQKLTESLKQNFIVENRAGAVTQIAGDLVVRSAPDGYTLFASASTQTLLPSLFPKITYDPIKDFRPISIVFSAPFLLSVSRTLPVKNIKDVVALAKARPGELSYGSAGQGSASHLTFELFKYVTKTNMVHIPYKGQGPAITDLISGEIQLMFNSLGAVESFMKTGRLRVLGVTSAQRLKALPDVPTFVESGATDMVTGSWYAFWAPAKTPESVVSLLNKEIVRITNLPDIQERIINMGGIPVGNSPADFAAFQEKETARWARIIKEARITLE